ncbi:MAG: hypothetical protein ACOC22_02175 [bacterium]
MAIIDLRDIQDLRHPLVIEHLPSVLANTTCQIILGGQIKILTPNQVILLLQSGERLGDDLLKVNESNIVISSDAFKALVKLGMKVHEILIMIEKPLSFLSYDAPEALVSVVPEKYQGYAKFVNEDETTYKTFGDCCRYKTNETNCLLEFGFVDENKNRDKKPMFEEIIAWVQHFPNDILWGGKLLKEKIEMDYIIQEVT